MWLEKDGELTKGIRALSCALVWWNMLAGAAGVVGERSQERVVRLSKRIASEGWNVSCCSRGLQADLSNFGPALELSKSPGWLDAGF